MPAALQRRKSGLQSGRLPASEQGKGGRGQKGNSRRGGRESLMIIKTALTSFKLVSARSPYVELRGGAAKSSPNLRFVCSSKACI